MKRINKIYKYICDNSRQYSVEQLQGRVGFTAAEISEKLGILRNNVSMELNTLFRMDKIIKIKGRPVLYFDKNALENLCNKKLDHGPIEVNSIEELINTGKDDLEKSPFQYLLGANESLKKQVEQAKAAILYPPNGLHTLIVGQTGVGKTLFAHMMYRYGKYIKKLNKDAPFISFNCADYYNNPQLLMSQIFGHIKGAFTGADANKQGLVELADGGILFLDEIHRLPPEGQEMIFYFIDTGTFSKLGETERRRKANVLIIGATTEDYTSVLIKAFVRRIPNVITIPPLSERSLRERVSIIQFLFSNEANRLNKPIKIKAEVIRALIGSISYGNVGQLKSNIQLVCAKSFLNGIHNKDYLEIDFKILPDSIKHGLLKFGVKRKELEESSKYLDEQMVIIPQGHKQLGEDDPQKTPFNLYKTIEDKVVLLRDEGIDDDLIKKFLSADINLHIKSFCNQFNTNLNVRQRILKIIDKNLLEFAEEIQQFVSKRLKKEYKDRFLYALCLHLSAFFKRIKDNQPLQYTNLESVVKEYPDEFKVALEIKGKIEEKYHIKVPKVELEYLTLLLSSVQETEQDGKVVIVVAAYGTSTASSMVEVVEKLLGRSDNIAAIDMPLEVEPQDNLDRMIEEVQEMNQGKGVLLLVDVGGWLNFETMIEEETKIKVRTVEMVSTPLVLEAARKADFFGMDLDGVYNSITKFKGYARAGIFPKRPARNNDVIVTICSSGEGTALKLKELVEEILADLMDEQIEVLPISVNKLKESIAEIEKKHNILAFVGVVNPGMGIPFVSLESLLDSSGEKLLKSIIQNKFPVTEKAYNDDNIVVKTLCEDSLKEFLTYLNPRKIISVLIEFQTVLEQELKREFNNSMKIRLMIHCGCAVERMVIKKGLRYSGNRKSIDAYTLACVRKASGVFKDRMQIEFTEDELLYIVEML